MYAPDEVVQHLQLLLLLLTLLLWLLLPWLHCCPGAQQIFLLKRCTPFWADFWTSSVCSASAWTALVARHVRRRPLALRKFGPSSVRIHQALRHHIMCLFDTSLLSCVGYASLSFRSKLFALFLLFLLALLGPCSSYLTLSLRSLLFFFHRGLVHNIRFESWRFLICHLLLRRLFLSLLSPLLPLAPAVSLSPSVSRSSCFSFFSLSSQSAHLSLPFPFFSSHPWSDVTWRCEQPASMLDATRTLSSSS